MFKKNFVVTFEIPENIYFDVTIFENAIMQYKQYAKLTSFTWIIITTSNPMDIANHLLQYLPTGSRIFVSKISASAAWNNLITNDQWLKNNL